MSASASKFGVTIVAALARNRIIGNQNRLPWRLPDDLSRFKRLTLGKPVIMGRKTFESIGRPLAERRNIVLTRAPSWAADGVVVARSLSEALALAAAWGAADETMVIGGAQIYAQALPLAHRLELTEIELDLEGDARFPEFDR
ncbi:MAG TPA: dihydrofolate reductase, partial [Alphaproteobacteria bacterium]|nr:dihydrofolate reductase [Alphaproteobacteria bacterium]